MTTLLTPVPAMKSPGAKKTTDSAWSTHEGTGAPADRAAITPWATRAMRTPAAMKGRPKAMKSAEAQPDEARAPRGGWAGRGVRSGLGTGPGDILTDRERRIPEPAGADYNHDMRTWLLLHLLLGTEPAPALRIASDATFPPFHYLSEAKAPTGFDIELARLAAERAGYTPQVLVRPYDDLLPGLTSGAHDLVAATTGVTPEREALYLFTKPYFETCQAALVRVGPNEPTTIAELRSRRVGAAGSGTSARALQGIAAGERVPLGKGEAGVPSLEKGAIDALIVDEYSAVATVRASSGRLRVLPDPVALEHYGFVLPLGRDDVKRRLDVALEALEREGAVRALRLRFGVERDAGWPIEKFRPQARARSEEGPATRSAAKP